jgi:hypothetical protein
MRLKLKKLLPIILTTTFLLSLNIVPANAIADDDYYCGNAPMGSFTVVNNVVTGNNGLCSGLVNIPDGVVEIEADAFSFNTLITSVTIPDSVLTIGSEAFRDCTSLTALTIGTGVTRINDYAFFNTRLSTVTIPNNVLTLGNGVFESSRLTTVTIGTGLTAMGDDTFGNNLALTSVTFEGNAPTVGEEPFIGRATGAKANVPYNATGFGANGSFWERLIVSYGSAPVVDSDSSSPTPVVTITPEVVKSADAVFNLKNKKYLSKDAMKTKLSKKKSFKRVPEDLYKYSISKSSKKTCAINENYVTGLKKTGTCNLYATRTTTKGVKYKYWVQINYTK